MLYYYQTIFFPNIVAWLYRLFGEVNPTKFTASKSKGLVFWLEKAVKINLVEDILCEENFRDARLF